MPHAYTEDQLVEQLAIGLFAELGWATASAAVDELTRDRSTMLLSEPTARCGLRKTASNSRCRIATTAGVN
jgi:hypothetical protein